MTGTGRDTIVPFTPTDIAAMVSATHGVGAASTADTLATMALAITVPATMALVVTDTDITMVTGTDTMMEYTQVTITTTTITTDHSLTATTTATGLTMAKPTTATTIEATVPTWPVAMEVAATAAWVVATTPTVHTPTMQAAVSMLAPMAEV